LLEVLRPYGVVEMVRTGRVEMARGNVLQAKHAAARAGEDIGIETRDVDGMSV
jgi:hypothetical protein